MKNRNRKKLRNLVYKITPNELCPISIKKISLLEKAKATVVKYLDRKQPPYGIVHNDLVAINPLLKEVGESDFNTIIGEVRLMIQNSMVYRPKTQSCNNNKCGNQYSHKYANSNYPKKAPKNLTQIVYDYLSTKEISDLGVTIENICYDLTILHKHIFGLFQNLDKKNIVWMSKRDFSASYGDFEGGLVLDRPVMKYSRPVWRSMDSYQDGSRTSRRWNVSMNKFKEYIDSKNKS